MSLDRGILLDLLQTYGNNDYDNIEHIVTTNSDIIRMDWYKRPGRGVNWVDKELSTGIYRTGVELYGSIPHSIERNLEENGSRTITFIEVSAIDRIAFKAPISPSWAWVAPPKSNNANLTTIRVNGTEIPEFDTDVLTYNITLPAGTIIPPTVTVTSEDVKSYVTFDQALIVEDTVKIKVVSEDLSTTKVYTIIFSL